MIFKLSEKDVDMILDGLAAHLTFCCGPEDEAERAAIDALGMRFADRLVAVRNKHAQELKEEQERSARG